MRASLDRRQFLRMSQPTMDWGISVLGNAWSNGWLTDVAGMIVLTAARGYDCLGECMGSGLPWVVQGEGLPWPIYGAMDVLCNARGWDLLHLCINPLFK